MRPIVDVAADLGLGAHEILPWGPGVAKIAPSATFETTSAKARLVLVSAISPTPAGEGKTTCAIGLTDAMRKLGVRAACALRQPSLGPVFGKKGGGTGGGRASLVPSERINLHLSGDIHAVGAAHDLLAAAVDNELHFGAPPRIDPRRVTLRRVIDLNDRALRNVVIGLGGQGGGVPRESGFDITPASEVMAILCLAESWADLKTRLGKMLVGFSSDGKPVSASDLGAAGAMAAILRDALLPNLVQTSEGSPSLVHGGPIGNIAHGCNSLLATRLALRRADLVFTEAGFGFDLGAEKFLDITCRTGGIWPHAVVLVATLRALSAHGIENLQKHIESARLFGLEPIVALNLRAGDDAALVEESLGRIRGLGVACGAIDVFGRGGEGALGLAEAILTQARAATTTPRFLYSLEDRPEEKIRRVAQQIYGARDVAFSPTAQREIGRAVELGFGGLPICIAKTHLSLSDDEKRQGRPRDFVMNVRELRIAAGAGFLVPLTGEILTMPGLPRRPNLLDIDLLPDGTIVGMA